MKSLLRAIFVNALSLYFLTLLLSGVRVTGGLNTYLAGGLVLAVVYKILKPILSIISLPLNIITLGFTSFLINVLLFYLATTIISQITVNAFTLNSFSFSGFIVPTIHFNSLFAYVAAAFVQSVIVSFISWIRK